MMSRAIRAQSILSQTPSNAAVSFFHSTPPLQRRRNAPFIFNSYATRFRRKEAKRTLVRDANLYLDHLLQGLRHSAYEDSQSASSDYTSWFEKQYFGNGRKKKNFHNEYVWESCSNKRKKYPKLFWSDMDDDECDTIFGSAFGTRQGFNWSFNNENFRMGSSKCWHERWDWKSDSDDDFSWRRNSSRQKTQKTQRVSWDWKDESEYENDASSKSDMTSDRLALGLNPSGPLKIEEVKKAYRACALKWHPDRHQGSSKGAAEEKFKYCTAAYQSICDKLIVV